MAYTTPRTWVAGEVVTASLLNTHLRDNVSFLANPPSCRVFNSGTQAVPDANFLNPVLYDSESHDTDTMHSTSVNTGRITINTAGIYVMSFTCQLVSAGDYLYAQAGITASVAGFLGGVTTQNNAAAYEPWLTVSPPPVKLAAADFLIAVVYQDNSGGVPRNIKANTCIFGATWIGLG